MSAPIVMVLFRPKIGISHMNPAMIGPGMAHRLVIALFRHVMYVESVPLEVSRDAKYSGRYT